MIASFMAKPFARQAGSGLHLHVSVLDRKARTSSPARRSSRRAAEARDRRLQRRAADCMLLFAPHANSYRRFVMNAFVPLNDCWGFNNRTVAMRIPHSTGQHAHRAPHRRRRRQSLPGRRGDPGRHARRPRARRRSRRAGGRQRLRADRVRQQFWRDSIERFPAQRIRRASFGERFRHIYGQQKAKEMRSFYAEVTTLEVEWYLRQV
jgi:glutamine synthetase